MNETTLWHYLRKGLAGGCLMTRIETSTGNGVPDVCLHFSGKHVWVELKHIPYWPKRKDTLVKLLLRPEQKLWLKSRGDLSGSCWVFVRVDDHFFLLSYSKALVLCDGATKETWIENHYNWWKHVDFNELSELLR